MVPSCEEQTPKSATTCDYPPPCPALCIGKQNSTFVHFHKSLSTVHARRTRKCKTHQEIFLSGLTSILPPPLPLLPGTRAAIAPSSSPTPCSASAPARPSSPTRGATAPRPSTSCSRLRGSTWRPTVTPTSTPPPPPPRFLVYERKQGDADGFGEWGGVSKTG